MTSPAQLVQTLSEVTGVALPTLVDIDRKLVKGGLRTIGGRGFNAAQMTALDAARLLTAVLASPQANAAAETVNRYTQTEPDPTRSSDNFFGATDLDDLKALPAHHSFVEGIAAVITSAAAGSLAKLIAESERGSTPRIEVYAFTRATYGRIRIAGLPNGLTANVEYLPACKKTMRKNTAAENTGDLEQSRRVAERTILSIAELLA